MICNAIMIYNHRIPWPDPIRRFIKIAIPIIDCNIQLFDATTMSRLKVEFKIGAHFPGQNLKCSGIMAIFQNNHSWQNMG